MYALILAAQLLLPPQVSDATFGVTAIHLETGKRVSVRGAERFPMGSVYKFPIALEVLKRVDDGKLRLDDKVRITEFSIGHSPLRDQSKGKPVTMTHRELLRFMVSLSDNTPCDYYIRTLGANAINARLKALGVSGIRVDRTEKAISVDIRQHGKAHFASDVRDTATPDAMADLLVKVWQRRDGLSKQSHDLLVQWMTVTPTGPNRVKAGLPTGATFIHKTGTMPGTTNDVGIIVLPGGKEHIVLAVFGKASKHNVTEEAEKDIAAIVRKVLEHFR
ncbi:MAG TPA: class A beta-lactamase [Thermoanaerobaculia bacterium]|nr:class A beta-lactamase [Thermoanaerobaculia bacterium]